MRTARAPTLKKKFPIKTVTIIWTRTFRNPAARSVFVLLMLLFITSCRTSREVASEPDPKAFTESDMAVSRLIQKIPDYSTTLTAIRGKGKAIVSEPGTTDRVTVLFASNKKKSLVTVKNGIGVEGGQILSDGDSLLIYNKIDKYARRVSIRDGDLHRINNLASLNILDLINFTVEAGQIEQIKENANENLYLLLLSNGGKIYVDRDTGFVQEVEQPLSAGLPYSRIVYDAYSKIEGFMLPRRITIFSADKVSKVNLLVQSLDINPELDDLEIDLPENITLYRR